MKIAVLGGTGYVGSYLVEELLGAGHETVLLTRPHGEAHRTPADKRCTSVPGDVGDTEAVRRTLGDADAVIYNIGILREYPSRGVTFRALHYEGARKTMDLAVEQNVRRFLLMSANGVKADGTPYQRTKFEAEQYLRASPLRWTIFRPSVLFGDPRGRMEFATQLYRDIVSAPLPLPLFYDGLLPFNAGDIRMSPVHARDVARVITRSLESDDSVGRIYPIGGPEAVRWKDILQRIAQATGKRRFGVPTPVWALKIVADMLSGLDILPVTRDQLTMLMEGNTCDATETFREFGIEPIPFDAVNLQYLSTALEKQ